MGGSKMKGCSANYGMWIILVTKFINSILPSKVTRSSVASREIYTVTFGSHACRSWLVAFGGKPYPPLYRHSLFVYWSTIVRCNAHLRLHYHGILSIRQVRMHLMIILTALSQNSDVIRRSLISLQIRVPDMRLPAHTETNVGGKST